MCSHHFITADNCPAARRSPPNFYFSTGLAATSLLALGLFTYELISRVTIHGELYKGIMEQKELFAEIVPPSATIIESYLVTLELVMSKQDIDALTLEQKLHRLQAEYRTRETYWMGRMSTRPDTETMLAKLRDPANQFFRMANEQLLPLIHDEQYDAAKNLVQGEMFEAYSRHRVAVDELVRLLQRTARADEDHAGFEMVSEYIPGIVASGTVLMIAIFVFAIRHDAVARHYENFLTETILRGQAGTNRELELLKSALDQVAIVAVTDVAGRILEVNEKFCQISEYDRTEVIGQTHRVVNSGWHPSEFWASMWNTINRGVVWRREVCNRAKSGRLYWVDTTIVPIRGDGGAVVRHVAIRIDITRRKSIEESLRLSETKARAVFDQSHQFIGLLQTNGKVIEVNRAALEFVAATPGEIFGRLFWETSWWNRDPESQERVKAAVRLAAAGELARFECEAKASDGTTRIVEFLFKPVRNELDKIVWLMLEGSDMTEIRRNQELLKSAKEAAEAANRAKSEFLANMSHEIRTPMSAILGFAEMLVNDVTEGEDSIRTIDAARTIHRNGEHLLEIINDILDLSKIEAGKMAAQECVVSPRAVIGDVVSLMSVRSRAKGIVLNVAYETPIPINITTDPLRLRQILVNLVGNAIKFTEVGEVRLIVRYLSADHGQLEFDVVDSGIGMSESQRELLFKPFMQIDTSMSRRFGGTGLGLTISKRLAQMLGGDVFVVESTPGVGTRFRLVVATGTSADVCLETPGQFMDGGKSPRQMPSTKISASVLAGYRILLAEDGPDNQALIKFVLAKAGAFVTVVENGQLAIDAAFEAHSAGHPFDLVLMDMQMPVLDGYRATAKLRSQGYVGPIIALTAHAMSGDREKCLAAGCDDFATKPIDRVGLISSCSQWIDKQSNAVGNSVPVVSEPGCQTNSLFAASLELPRSDVLDSELADDEDVHFLIRRFLLNLGTTIEKLDAAFAAEDLVQLASLSHQLKGSGGGYGYPSITTAAQAVERLAKSQAAPQLLHEAIVSLKDLCHRAIAGRPRFEESTRNS